MEKVNIKLLEEEARKLDRKIIQLRMKRSNSDRKESMGWMILAEKSLEKIWENRS
jgi:hypothetical protein